MKNFQKKGVTNLHIIGTGKNEIMILDEVRPPVLYLLHEHILAIPADPMYDNQHILSCFIDTNEYIDGFPMDEQWGWRPSRIYTVNLSGFKCWHIYDRHYGTPYEYGLYELRKIEEIYKRNIEKRMKRGY